MNRSDRRDRRETRKRKQPLRRPTPWAAGPDAEDRAASGAHLAGPAEGGGCLTLAGVVAGITYLHGKTRQELQTAPKGSEDAVMRQQQSLQSEQIVRARHRRAQLLEQGFQVLLGALLTMEAGLVMKRFATSSEFCGEPVVFLRLVYPFGGHALHTTPCLLTQPRAETNRPP